jgi:hypothetical protein
MRKLAMSQRLAARAGSRNPHVPAHTGRRRQPRRRRRRRRGRGRRIISLPNITGVIRALGNIARTLGHPVPGVANVHVPFNALVRPTPIHIEGIPWAPLIRAIAARTPSTIARLGGTCTQAQPSETQTAGHQHSRCQSDDYSFHSPSFRYRRPEWAGRVKVAADAFEDSCGAAQPG